MSVPMTMTATFEAITHYDWANDAEFQTGLHTILGSAAAQDPVLAERLTKRAQCYYLARKNSTTVDFDAYEKWLTNHVTAPPEQPRPHTSTDHNTTNGTTAPSQPVSHSQAPSNPAPSPAPAPPTNNHTTQSFTSPYGDAPAPASFAEICRMVSEGIPVPGIKEIPDTVLDGQSSASCQPQRRKPWESAGVRSSSGGFAGALRSSGDEVPAWQVSGT